MSISGWGKSETATTSDVSLQAEVSLNDSADCEQKYYEFSNKDQKSLKRIKGLISGFEIFKQYF